jgi:hypothetical protein
MNIDDLIKLLLFYKDNHIGTDFSVVIPLQNPKAPSMACSAIKTVHAGFDWDHGNLFLVPEMPLISHVRVKIDQIKEKASENIGYSYLINSLPRNRKDCYYEGFIDGAKWGSVKVIQE